MSAPLLDDLNESQKEAVVWGKSPLLILAGAGSGKTRILTRRIAYLIAQGTPSFHILGVTFTNKAAQEMKSRITRLTSCDVWVSTFHSTCLRILRQDGLQIELDRQFSIYDEHDQLILLKECMKELNLNEKQLHPKGVRERIQRAKDYLISAYQYAEKADDYYDEMVGKVYKLYEDKMKRLIACDFGDLIMKTVFLLDRCPAVLESWQNRFRHILIDEYQDTNHAQYRFVKLLASREQQITVVGDPDQSIYAWRGADIKNILNFEQDYPDCGIIKMEQNYRSTETILDAANEVIRHNRTRKPKMLWTEQKGGEKIRVFEARDEKEEAMYVVEQIRQALTQGRSLADQVIFYRVHAQSRILEDCLRRFNIPYKIVGGVRFYDRKEIKDLIAYLKVIAAPHDEISLKRILNVPARGIGKKALETLEAYAQTHQILLYAVLSQAAKINDLSPQAKKSIAAFHLLLTRWRKDFSGLAVTEMLHQVLEKTGYLEELEHERTIESQARIENIEEFFSVVEDFQSSYNGAPEEMLRGFLESISLVTDLDQWNQGTNVLTMMTLHTAKGLEFPYVYMVGLEEGIFPNVKALTDDVNELEEERRLCYVGVTRAKERLFLIYARERLLYGSRQFNLPSRFLTEIPAELLHFERPGSGDFASKSVDETLLDDDLLIEFED